LRIRVLAGVTFVWLLRNKLVLMFLAVFLCVVLFMMAPIRMYKSMAENNPGQFQGIALSLVTFVMGLVSGFGSLLAAWSAADAVASEMRTGTIMAVMARPIRRWEFLLGKYCGVQMLMMIYVVFMFGVTNILASMSGQRLATDTWVLLVYPMVRYAIYGAMAILLVTILHPVVAFIIVLISGVLANVVAPSSAGAFFLPEWLRRGLYILLPSVNLLSETNFLTITSAKVKQTPWTDHAIALTYGLDYAVMCLVLAGWAFHRRSLTRE
jgi:ABC-type transport system involved in multi-copper enzyme maturation permease subunit